MLEGESERRMVLSKMYCSEQIVVPEKISNLLKTYAKAALKTQPYDLLRWSAAYFRCLSMDMMPPVKLRYELDNSLNGRLTKGYMRVLTSQLGKGFFVDRDVLERRWSELCLPEDELLKFLSLTRMLYWPQVHWLKLMSVMVGSINQNFHETIMMLFELLTDEPEGGASPVPLWTIRECFEYLARLDCSEEQTFFDARKMLPGNVLEDETKMPSAPQKFSSTSYRNAVIDYWKFRIESDEKEKPAAKDDDKVCTFCSIPMSLRCGSELNLSGDFSDPNRVIRSASDFSAVVKIARHLECGESKEKQDDEASRPQDIGPPWNWLHSFVSHNCRDKSFNFLELVDGEEVEEEEEEEENGKEEETAEVPQPQASLLDDVQSTASGVSKASSEHRSIVEAICNLSAAFESNDTMNIRETAAIGEQLREQFERNQLDAANYERLKKFTDRAVESGLVFNDLNALYSYFIQESSREQQNLPNTEVENSTPPSDGASNTQGEQVPVDAEAKSAPTPDKKNVVSIFGESGIEVDNKLLDAKVSERMILGLVDKAASDVDNVSDVPSSNASMSSLSNAETVRLREVTREKNTQTMSYSERVHERRLMSERKSSSSLARERLPYTCKIPPLAGIGGFFGEEKIGKVVKFIVQRSYEQGGFVYSRNFLEDDCPNLA